jgi:hypothetical protein
MSSNAPLFSGTSGGLASLSSGFGSTAFGGQGGQYEQQLYNMLGKTYGQGTGQLLGNILEQGLFNPQTAAAFLNAMQPSINQGTQSIQNQFGAEGARFGSEDSLGLSNFLGQANLNEQQTLASMYEQAQTEQLQILSGVLPSLQAERADSGGFMNTFGDVYKTIMGVANLVTGPVPNVSQPAPSGSVPATGGSAAQIGYGTEGMSSSGGLTFGGDTGSDFGTMSAPLEQLGQQGTASAALGGAGGELGELGELGSLLA